MGDNQNIDGSGEGISSLPVQEKGSRNKRKFLSEPPLEIPDISTLSLTEFPRYEVLEEKYRKLLNHLRSLGVRTDQAAEVPKGQWFDEADWLDPTVLQLEQLLKPNILEIFDGAIKKIVECGYSEEVAKLAVLRSGFHHGAEDAVSNVLDDALDFLGKEKKLDTSTKPEFEDLPTLVVYTMLEAVHALKAVGPSISLIDAMWRLLLCDMNVVDACKDEPDFLGGLSNVPGQITSGSTPTQSKSETSKIVTAKDTTPQLSKLSVPGIHELLTTEKEGSASLPDEGTADAAKGSASSRRDVHRQKSYQLEKGYGGRVGKYKAKLTAFGGVTMKSQSGQSALLTKSAYSKKTASAGSSGPLAEGSGLLASKDVILTAPVVQKPPSTSSADTKRTLNSDVSSPVSAADYYAGIPYDESLGKYVPRDDKDETILILGPQEQLLQKEIEGWTDWANEKVMQATRRLGKDQVELKTMRQEKEETEKFKRDRQLLEETTMKRLSEMEHALSNTTGQIEVANCTILRLEAENNTLKKDLEAAKLRALEASKNLQEARMREQEAQKKCQSSDMEKSLLQEEMKTLDRGISDLQHRVEKAKDRLSQLEALWKQEEKEKIKFQRQADILRKENEELEALTKKEEDEIRLTAERDMQKLREQISKLEFDISAMKLESETLKIAALRRGSGASYNSGVIGKDVPPIEGLPAPRVNKRLEVFRDNFGGDDSLERECVMCLNEEATVVFLPCSHQVVCADCNDLHEKKGMDDCPSCRTPIQHRINPRYD